MNRQTSIFISHAWGGVSDEVLAQLVKRLESENIRFILDKRDLSYRQSIRDFMVQLGEADMVIIILSNKYLKSEYCMFELLEIHKNENLNERIFPIVLEEVKISSSSDRIEFVKYWENQLIELQNKVKELNSLSYIEGITDDLNLYSEIRNNIARLTGILRDINTLNMKLHQDSDYNDLVSAIKTRISQPNRFSQHENLSEPEHYPQPERYYTPERTSRSERTAQPERRPKPEQKSKRAIIPPIPIPVQNDPLPGKPESRPLLNSTNLKRSGIALFVVGGLFVVWKFVIQPKPYSTDDDYYYTGGTIPIDSNAIITGAIFQAILRDSLGEFQDMSMPVEEETQDNSQENTYTQKQSSSSKSTSTKKQSDPVEKHYYEPKKQPDPVEKNYYQPTNTTGGTVLKTPSTIENHSTTDDEPITIDDDPAPIIFSNPKKEESSGIIKAMKSATIPKGTEIQAKSSSTFSSDDAVAIPRQVYFTLGQPLNVGGNTVISAGSLIVAKVLKVKKSDYKSAGNIRLVFEYLQAPDGQKVLLEGNDFFLIADGDVPYEVPMHTVFKKIKISSTIQILY